MNAAATITPVLGVTAGSTKQKQRRNRKNPSVNATFRIPPDLKDWLEQTADELSTTAAAIVVEQLTQLRALVRITRHISGSMRRNMAKYEKQQEFLQATRELRVRHVTTWEAGGTLESTIQRLAWDNLQEWLKQDPAERDAWLRFVVEGTEYWTPPESVTADLFDERNDMMRVPKPEDPDEQERVRTALKGMRVEHRSPTPGAGVQNITQDSARTAQLVGAPRVKVKPIRETHTIESTEEDS